MPLHKLVQYAVWSNLDQVDNTELIILKGHLLLESVIDKSLSFLVQRGDIEILNLSFYKKLQLLRLLHVCPDDQFSKAQNFVIQLNKIRNRLAHQIGFDGAQTELSVWAAAVLNTFPGIKFSKYTFRTKVVHAFASLAAELSRSADSKITGKSAAQLEN